MVHLAPIPHSLQSRNFMVSYNKSNGGRKAFPVVSSFQFCNFVISYNRLPVIIEGLSVVSSFQFRNFVISYNPQARRTICYTDSSSCFLESEKRLHSHLLLNNKDSIFHPKIVPIEHKQKGALPPAWHRKSEYPQIAYL